MAPARSNLNFNTQGNTKETAFRAHQELGEKELQAKAARAEASTVEDAIASHDKEVKTCEQKVDTILMDTAVVMGEVDLLEAARGVAIAGQLDDEFLGATEEEEACLDDWSSESRYGRWRNDNADLIRFLRTSDDKRRDLEKEAKRLKNEAVRAEGDLTRQARSVKRRFGSRRTTKLRTLWVVADCLEAFGL